MEKLAMMTIHWDATIDDALEFYKYYVETDSRVKDNILIIQFLIPLIACVLFYIYYETWNWGIIGLSIMWILFTPFVRRRQLMNNAERAYMESDNFRNFGPLELVLSEEGFLLKTDSCETLFKWKSVTNVIRVPGYCFIDIEKQEILIIPEKRLTVEEVEAITQALNTYVEINGL